MSKLQLLVPMDGTEFSRRIVPEVHRLFAADRWELKLLHVARVPIDPGSAAYGPAAVGPDYRLYLYGYEMPGANLHPVYDEEQLEEFRASLENELQDEVRTFQELGYEVSAAVHFGEPAEAIVSYAEHSGVDLVAMATHHRKGFDRLIHGSVARRALNRLALPTLLVRVDDDGEAGAEEQSDAETVTATQGSTRDRTSGAMASGTASGTASRAASRAAAGTASTMAGGAAGGMALGAMGAPSDTTGEGELTSATTAPVDRAGGNLSKDDQTVTPADTEAAVLGGLEGRGVLTLMHDSSGRIVETKGSWFPSDPDLDLTPLESARTDGRTVLFEGVAVEAETVGHDHDHGEQVRREVKVTSVRRYRDYGGNSRTLVSFEVTAEAGQTDVPSQFSRTEFQRLSLDRIADLTGLQPPDKLDAQQEAEYREKAWKSYELDVEHRDEWGTARQNTVLPRGE